MLKITKGVGRILVTGHDGGSVSKNEKRFSGFRGWLALNF